jgi:hypothetical protein
VEVIGTLRRRLRARRERKLEQAGRHYGNTSAKERFDLTDCARRTVLSETVEGLTARRRPADGFRTAEASRSAQASCGTLAQPRVEAPGMHPSYGHGGTEEVSHSDPLGVGSRGPVLGGGRPVSVGLDHDASAGCCRPRFCCIRRVACRPAQAPRRHGVRASVPPTDAVERSRVWPTVAAS